MELFQLVRAGPGMLGHRCGAPAALRGIALTQLSSSRRLVRTHRKERLNRRATCPPCAAKSKGGKGTLPKGDGASDDAVEAEPVPSTAAQQPKGDASQSRKASGSKEKRQAAAATAADDDASLNVDDFNPVVLGRKSRQLLNDVWKQFTKLSSPVSSRTTGAEDIVFSAASEVGEFETPQAASTTVLVVGGSGRVGRVLVRKLVLRGYTVRVLTRAAAEAGQALPSSVEIVEGGLEDAAACRQAIAGADKIVFCAHSRSGELEDVRAVELQGVVRVARELQDQRNARALSAGHGRNPGGKLTVAEAAQFAQDWAVQGPGQGGEDDEDEGGLSASLLKSRRSKFTPKSRDTATVSVNDRNNLLFEGKVHTQGGHVQVGTRLQGTPLAGCEGLMLRARGDGQSYVVQLTQESGQEYTARLATQLGFLNFRLPFNAFRYTSGGEGPAPLDPARLTNLAIRFENPKVAKAVPPVVNFGDTLNFGEPLADSFAKDFTLELDRVKALPGGQETDFILVSCAGAAGQEAPAPGQAAALSLKRRAEVALRGTGLGYTIVRPGPLLEEPGGYKALVFDQGERITQGISCADVADVCLKALHDPAARNKTFEVCHEYTPEQGLEQYELVAHLPDKANNYLGPALAVLEKNT